MNKEYNFPIKYAIEALKEKGGYITNYKDIVRGYIVSKCWVTESSIKYFSDGKSKIFHKVIFPYNDFDALKQSLRNDYEYIGEKVTPRFDYNYNPYPIDIVSDLFDTYKEAKIKANEKNEEIEDNIASEIYYSISDPRFKQTLKEYKKEYLEHLSICLLFEKLSLSKTKDMAITKDIEPNQKIKSLNIKNCR